MFKYAQILNNKVHWIFTDDMALDEIYKHKYSSRDIQLVDISYRGDIQEGWNYDGVDFSAPVVPQPTIKELLVQIRTKRNQLLTECDWTQLPDAPLTAEQKQAWAVYRQALRDMPETCDPCNPVWPMKPY